MAGGLGGPRLSADRRAVDTRDSEGSDVPLHDPCQFA
jgi:hypothetical protein